MFDINTFPPKFNFDKRDIWQALNIASRSLAELKGESKTIPNSDILINTLSLQESKESSAIENIITTQDDLFRSQMDDNVKNIAAKEIKQYAAALSHGYMLIKTQQLFTSNHILEIQAILEPNKPGFRKIMGAALKNSSGEIVYTPPQSYQKILDLMSDLDKYINLPELHTVDPLIKMALIHYQFESIHPFYDGNGRTGRIINILYLVYTELIDIPVLYLSRYINQNRGEYYRLLQKVRTDDGWDEWVIWLLNGVHITAQQTNKLIRKIKLLIDEYQKTIAAKYPNIASRELLDSLFKHPYTKIKFIEYDLGVHRHTARKYLEQLVAIGLLEPRKIGRSSYYINKQLFAVLSDAGS